MAFTKLREGENIEEALRRFKRACEREGIRKEMRRREEYLPPSVVKQRKRRDAERRMRRRGKRRQ